MNNDTSKKWLLVGVAAAGVVAGVVGGYFAAHVGMSDMPGMTTGKGDVKGMDTKAMQGMEGMKGMQPGAVAIPAVTRQLIGVRTVPVTYALLEQEIRAVGTVEYDERKLTKVNLRVSGWIEQVFVNAIGQSVRAGQPLLTRSEEHTSELQSQSNLVCRLLLEKKKEMKVWNRS